MSHDRSGKADGPRSALSKAWEDIASADVEDMASRAQAVRSDDGSLTIAFLGKEYSVQLDKKRILRASTEGKVSAFVSSLILHYLIGAKRVEPSGKLLTFRELEGGNVYYDAFYRRAILPLAQGLGDSPSLLAERARRVCGTAMDLGDASTRIQVFPRLPVVAVVWRGDEEVPSSANILFDSTAGLHLHTEDLAVVGDLVADVLVLTEEEWRGCWLFP